ncbi:MAG: BTAD domain-containing putative transcriptional regulator [Ramlibacter sp.]
MGLSIHLLGPPRIEREGKAVAPPRGQKTWALLAYLLLCDTTPTRQHLAGLLFADAEDGLGALRWNLSELRRALGVPASRTEALHLALEPTTYVDVRVLRRGSWLEAIDLPALEGDLLEGMTFPSSPGFDVWLATERRHLQATVEAVLHEAALARMARGAMREAADLAARLVTRNPLDENHQTLLVRALAAAGDGVGAARQAAACRELFQRELGVSPGPALDSALNTVTDHAVSGPVSGRGAALAQLEAGQAAIAAGATEAGLQCLRRAVAESDATGDAVLRGRARIALGGALIRVARGRDEEGAAALHEALAIGIAAGSAVAASAARELGYVEFLRGGYHRSLAWLAHARNYAGDDLAERARIDAIAGAVMTDTSHYGESIAILERVAASAESAADQRQLTHALSMLGRANLLLGHLDASAAFLDRSVAMATQGWTAFLPWPESLRAEVDIARGDAGAATERLEHAFALSCHIGDPCWESMAARGLGRVALKQGRFDAAAEAFVDAIRRSVRLPDSYVWGKAYALDALCDVGVERRMPQAIVWVGELQQLAARTGMREMTVRSHMHRARLGDRTSGEAASLLAAGIDNPVLWAQVGQPAVNLATAEGRRARF